MTFSSPIARIVFPILAILFSISFTMSYFDASFLGATIGLVAGLVLSAMFLLADALFKKMKLRSFATATLGLLIGFVMGQLILSIILAAASPLIPPPFVPALSFFTTLFFAYAGLVTTRNIEQELRCSVPFIDFTATQSKKKELVLDPSALLEPRFNDLVATGLFNQQLLIPRFTVKNLCEQAETADEATQVKARRTIEALRKLEATPQIELHYSEHDYPEIRDPAAKILHFARANNANILTSDPARPQQSIFEGVLFINLFSQNMAFKPVSNPGEFLSIKIQRYGKEPRQGVGYLDDGTMVVVNGGAEFFGETIKANVLSIKQTPSGRMIFCNASEEGSLLTAQNNSTGLPAFDNNKPSLAL